MSAMDGQDAADSTRLSARAKLTIGVVVAIVVVVFLLQVRSIISPFLWALLAAYLLNPIVNYLNLEGGLPRIWAVALIYAAIGLLLVAGSRYLYPQIVAQGTLFLEDLPRLEASIIARVGPKPLGLDVSALVSQLLGAVSGYTNNTKSASHFLVNAMETVIRLFLFLVSTFYLLLDSSRIKRAIANVIPPAYQPELITLGRQINLTWQQYIRGELVLFAIMATVTTIGLSIFGVPGAIFLGLASGALELLPFVGPLTAGTLAVTVAYFNDTNPFGWSQTAYAGAIALMYFVLRETEDYVVIPHVLGRAVRLHPLVVLFSVAAGGVFGGLLGLIIAVPIAASVKAISYYLYAKFRDLPVEFEPVRTIGGGVIEIPVHGTLNRGPETTSSGEAGTA